MKPTDGFPMDDAPSAEEAHPYAQLAAEALARAIQNVIEKYAEGRDESKTE